MLTIVRHTSASDDSVVTRQLYYLEIKPASCCCYMLPYLFQNFELNTWDGEKKTLKISVAAMLK